MDEKMRRLSFTAMLSLLCSSHPAFAQYVIGDTEYVCPIGAAWNDPRCIRQPVEDGSDQSGAMDSIQASAPSGEWRTTWGAIAYDSTTGNAGTITEQVSKTEAETAALDRCSNGGRSKDCRILTSFSNQCAAVAQGNGRVFAIGGATLEAAQDSALSDCARGGDECKIVYSDCSKPEFIRY